MDNRLDIEFVWNETLAEQIQYETKRAMRSQTDEIRRTAEQFKSEADRHKERADQLRDRLPIMKIEQRTGTRTNRDGYIETYIYRERVEDLVASRELEEEAREMEEQAEEVLRAAEELIRAADELERLMEEAEALVRKLFELVQRADMSYAGKIMAIKEQIAAFINKMNAIRDSFGGEPSNPFTAGDVASLIGSAIGGMGLTEGVFCPTLAQLVAGIQRASKDIFDPINSATGNFYYTKDDIIIGGRYPLVFKRFYNAVGGQDGGMLGSNWTHNFNIRLYDNGEQVHIVFDDGHVETYTRRVEGFYSPPLDRTNVLTLPEDGSKGFVLHFQSLQQYCFDENGHLFMIYDENGNDTALEYDGDMLTKVSNTCGALSFSYNENSLLSCVTDHTGRKVDFEYTDGNLIKVTHPSGAILRYEYGKDGLISKVIDPLGIATVHNEYDQEGRTVVQHMPDGGVARLEYDDKKLTTSITEQNGNRVVYFRDKYYRTVKAVYDDFEENYLYDAKNMRTGHTDRNNNTWWYEFDIYGNTTKTTDPLGNTVIANYNIFNKITKLVLQNGGEMLFTYDEHGNQTSSIDPVGRITRCKTDDHGRMYALVLPDSAEYEMEFDERGNVITLVDGMGAKTLYEYNNLNQVIKATDGKGTSTLFEYNSSGDVAKVSDAMGNSQTYLYNLAGRVICATDFNGGSTEYEYDAIGNLINIINPCGISTKSTFDVMQNTTSITDHNGNTIYYEYDQYRRITKVIDEEGNATQYEYDNNGNMTAATDPMGRRTEIVYDELNRHRKIIAPGGATVTLTYDKGGNLTYTTDPIGNITEFEYDLAGQMTKLIDPMGNVTQFTYTSLGQRESITNANGERMIFSYYPGGRLKSSRLPTGETEIFEYDQNGNISKVTDTAGGITILEYDCLNRVIKSTNAIGMSKKFAYDAMGNITQFTDENGNMTEYKYSPIGDIVEVVDATGHSTKYNYDNMSRLTKTEQACIINDPNVGLNNHHDYLITTYERNKKGDIVAITSPMGDIVKYDYDKLGRMIRHIDEDGFETLYSYNLVGTLAKVGYADGKTVEFSYDALRRLTEMRDWLGTTSIEMDALGRIIQTTDHEGNEVAYAWDKLGQREKITYPDGRKVSYEYDASGRLGKVLSGAGVTSYSYDRAGRISERILPDNTKTLYDYNALGLISSLTHSKNSKMLDQFTYAYDPVGNIVQIEKHRSDIDVDNGKFKYVYDPRGRLLEAVNGQNYKTYAYDATGNRVTSMQNGIETKYSYNARNQLTRATESGIESEYIYDKRGNLANVIQNGQLTASYTCDATNMVISAFNRNKGTVDYTYNGLSNRVRKIENLQAGLTQRQQYPCRDVKYVLDITQSYDNLLMTQGSHEQNYIWGNELLFSGKSDNTSFYYLQDHLGSPIRLMGTGNDSEALAYDEFGVPMIEARLSGKNNAALSYNNPFSFTGYQADNISGLQYAQARYYNPSQGRFTAEDSVKDGLNWYGYCGGNPINFTDPSGLYRILSNSRPEFDCSMPGTFVEVGSHLCSCPAPAPITPACTCTYIGPNQGNPRFRNHCTHTVTTSIEFTTEFGAAVTAAVNFIVPGSNHILRSIERGRGVIGGPSATSASVGGLVADIGMWATGKLTKGTTRVAQNIRAGYTVATTWKYYQGLGKYFTASSRASMDQIIRGYFERNNIPTYHVVVLKDGQRKCYASIALLTAQMDAANAWLLANREYFFTSVSGHNSWHRLDQALLAANDYEREIQRQLDAYRQYLSHQRYVFGGMPLPPHVIRDLVANFEDDLRRFRAVSSAMELSFVATMASATCGALAEIRANPPIPAPLPEPPPIPTAPRPAPPPTPPVTPPPTAPPPVVPVVTPPVAPAVTPVGESTTTTSNNQSNSSTGNNTSTRNTGNMGGSTTSEAANIPL